MEFVGANAAARISGENLLPGSVNYFLGNDPARWRTGVPTYARVRVADLYPSISLIHYGNPQHLEYDFVVAPGGDPAGIAIRFQGADQVSLDPQGDLVLRLGAEEIRQPKPLIYQEIQGIRKEIAGGYSLADPQTVKFEIAAYDHSLPLVIDPVLSYSTFYGGSGVDAAWGVAVDTNGFVYLAGESMGGLPTTVGTSTNSYGGGRTHGDAFVAKFDNRASQVVYLAYVGGASDDVALSLAVDSGGNAFITGYTESTDFPCKSAVFNTISGKPYPGTSVYPLDGFVTKLGPRGTNLVYSTYLGGNWVDEGVGIAVDPAGCAYVAGYTESTNFPTANASGAFQNFGGLGDAFVTKFGPEGTNLLYSIFLGGDRIDVGNDIAADMAGLAYVAGYTASTNFPVTSNAVQPWNAGDEDVFVTVLGNNGTNLVSSTYLGDAGKNQGYRLALDAAGGVYVTGATKDNSGYPVTPGGLNLGGLFLSGDGGANWNASNTGLQSVDVWSLAVNPLAPDRVYAGTSRGVARSSNGGLTWSTAISASATSAGLAPAIAVGSVRSLVIDPVGATNLYAGTAQGVFKSSDAGLNWWLISASLIGDPSPFKLAIDPVDPAIIYGGGNAGVYVSTNGATNWSTVNSGLGNLSVRALAIPPSPPAMLYAATAGGVYRSQNRGGNWLAANTGLTNLSVQAIAIDPVTPATVYAGTAGGVFKSVNAATNWAAVNAGLSVTNVTALAIDPLTPTTIYAGTTNGLFKSTDAGASWNPITNGFSVPQILAVVPNPQSPSNLYAGTRGTNSLGGEDAFVTKLGTNGYSVILGGFLDDQGWDVTVDAAGHAHLVGTTLSTNFPTRNPSGLLRATNAGLRDVFVAELGSDGTTLINSAYFGGADMDSGFGITLDAVGNAYIVGETSSADFPTRAALQPIYRGSKDAFLAKISSPAFQPVIDILAVSNQVQLSWTALAAEFKLQSNTNLLATNGWVSATAPPIHTNRLLTVSLPATNAAQSFRLSNP